MLTRPGYHLHDPRLPRLPLLEPARAVGVLQPLLDAGAGDSDRPENYLLAGKQLEQRQIITEMRILDLHLIECQTIHLAGKPVIA